MIKKSLTPLIKHVVAEDRFVAIVFGDCMFITVYMPVDDGSQDSRNISIDLLTEISSIIDNSKEHKHMFFGGDLNVNLSSNRQYVE